MAEEVLSAVVRAELGQFRREMDKMARIVQQSGQKVDRTNRQMASSFETVAKATRAFGAAIAATGIALFAKQAIDASSKMVAMQNAFKVITGSANAAKKELQFLRETSDRLGINFAIAAKSFQGLAAAANGTSLAGEKAREIFVSFAEASRVLGLSTVQMNGALTAVQQIMSKGTVQAEELRGQLGERLPGAFQIAARAMGVTTQALGKMLEQGQILATDFLPKFARQLKEELGKGVADAANTFQSQWGRMSNAVFDLLATFGDLITKNPDVLKALSDTTKSIESLTETIKILSGPLSSFVGFIARLASGITVTAAEELRLLASAMEEVNKAADKEKGSRLGAWIRGVGRLVIPVLGDMLSPTALGETREELEKFRRQLIETRIEAQGYIDLWDEENVRNSTSYLANSLNKWAALQKIYKKFTDELKLDKLKDLRLQLKQINQLIDNADKLGIPKDHMIALRAAAEKAKKEIKGIVEATNEADAAAKNLLGTWKELGDTIEEQIAKDGLEAFGEAMASLEDDIEEGKRVAKEYIEEIKEDREKAEKEYTETVKKELEKQQKAWTDFASKVEDRLADVFQKGFSGAFDLLDFLKEKFFAVLAQMAARAATQQIVIPILLGMGGTGTGGGILQLLGLGGATGAGGATGGGGILGGLFGGGGGIPGIGSIGNLLGGGGIGGLGGGGITGGLGRFLNMPLFHVGGVGGLGPEASMLAGDIIGGGGLGALGGAPVTIGGLLGAAGVGAGIGALGPQLLGSLGVPMLGQGGMGGMIGGGLGAAIGSIIPGVGTILGGIAGGFLGDIIGGLFGGGGSEPQMKIVSAIAQGVGGEEFQALMAKHAGEPAPPLVGTGFTTGAGGLQFGGLSMVFDRRKIDSDVAIQMADMIDQSIKQMLGSVATKFQAFSPEMQDKLLDPLNELAGQFAASISGVEFDGEGIEQEFQKFMEETLPDTFQGIFGDLVAAIESSATPFMEVISGLTETLAGIKEEHDRVMLSIQSQRTALIEALMTPAEIFVKRRNLLDETMASFRTGSGADRIALLPQIQSLVGELFRLGQQQDVLGQDMPGVGMLQQDLLKILDEVGTVMDLTYTSLESEVSGQLGVAEQQLDALMEAVTTQGDIKAVLEESQVVLEQILATELGLNAPGSIHYAPNAPLSPGSTNFAAPSPAPIVGSFQGGTDFVPQTGFAYVHQGERIIPAGEHAGVIFAEGAFQIHITGSDSPLAVADEVVTQFVERLDEESRFGYWGGQ